MKFLIYMRYLKVIFIAIGCLQLCSCSIAPIYFPDDEFLSSIEDLHIDEDYRYPESPFDSLTDDAFRKNTHYCTLLDIGDEALLMRVHLARIAQKAIYVQTFIWDNDETGRLMLYELIQAAKRGVKVKIIVDQLAQIGDPKAVAFLTTVSPNMEIKFYNPNVKKVNPPKLHYLQVLTRFKQINQRMHNKIFVVDDRIGIIGGRNYQNDYFDRGKGRNFKDRDVLIVGPVVKAMTDSFMYYWSYQLSIPSQEMLDVKAQIDKGSFDIWNGRADYKLNGLFHELDKNATDYNYVKKVIDKQTFVVDKVEFIADLPGKNVSRDLKGGGLIVDELGKLFAQAKERIIIQTPYLVLDKKSRKFFKQLKKDTPGLEILVSSNSLASADHFYAYAFSYKYKKFYVKNLKWRIFEFKLRPKDVDEMAPLIEGVQRTKDYFTCIHSKTFVVDKDKTYIGSFNIDPRSIYLNTEAGVVIYDEEFTQAATKNILRDMSPENSWAIAKRRNIPFVSHFSGVMDDIMKIVPIIDIWPYSYAASFELIEGKEELPHYHEDFYESYKSVGPFPDIPLTAKEIKARLVKAFLGPIEPLI